MKFGKNLTKLSTALGFVALSAAASAGSTTPINMAVTLTTVANCSVAATGISFGTVLTPIVNNVSSTGGQITVNCSAGSPTISLGLAATSTTGNTVAARKLASGANSAVYLNYNLFTNSTLSQLWGDGTLGTSTVAAAADGTSHNYPVFGILPGGQTNGIQGAYTDTVSVVVNF